MTLMHRKSKYSIMRSGTLMLEMSLVVVVTETEIYGIKVKTQRNTNKLIKEMKLHRKQ